MRSFLLFFFLVLSLTISRSIFSQDFDKLFVGVEKRFNNRVAITICFVDEKYSNYLQIPPILRFGQSLGTELQVNLAESNREGKFKRYDVTVNPELIKGNDNIFITFEFKSKDGSLSGMTYSYDVKTILSNAKITNSNNNCSDFEPVSPTYLGGESRPALG